MASLTARSLTLRRVLAASGSSSSSSTKISPFRSISSLLSGNHHQWLNNNNNHQQDHNKSQQQQYRYYGSGQPGVIGEREKPFLEKGWIDERGLTQFDTLHENQVRACALYAKNELYGLYNEETGEFEFETYEYFGKQVNKARDVLKHLGTLFFLFVSLSIIVMCVCVCVFGSNYKFMGERRRKEWEKSLSNPLCLFPEIVCVFNL